LKCKISSLVIVLNQKASESLAQRGFSHTAFAGDDIKATRLFHQKRYIPVMRSLK
jgi:hypothetical protein